MKADQCKHCNCVLEEKQHNALTMMVCANMRCTNHWQKPGAEILMVLS